MPTNEKTPFGPVLLMGANERKGKKPSRNKWAFLLEFPLLFPPTDPNDGVSSFI